jgi:hypothetical protein
MHYKIESSQYGDVIELDVYNDKYSLVAAREGQEGKIFKKWGHYQTKDRTPSEKAIPWSVGRMERGEMIEMLKHFLGMLEGTPVNSGHEPVDESPF